MEYLNPEFTESVGEISLSPSLLFVVLTIKAPCITKCFWVIISEIPVECGWFRFCFPSNPLGYNLAKSLETFSATTHHYLATLGLQNVATLGF